MKVLIVVHFMISFRCTYQNIPEVILSDPRLTEFVWFEEPDYNFNHHLSETQETQEHHEEKMNQSDEVARQSDETFAEYFFANKWK